MKSNSKLFKSLLAGAVISGTAMAEHHGDHGAAEGGAHPKG